MFTDRSTDVLCHPEPTIVYSALNSSIEDLLSKISKIRSDYESSHLPQSATPQHSSTLKETGVIENRDKMKASDELSLKEDVSTQFSHQIYSQQILQRENSIYNKEVSLTKTTTFISRNHDEPSVHQTNSLKLIHQQNDQIGSHKVYSLFYDQSIKEVGQSRIIGQISVGEGSYSKLDSCIAKSLKDSFIGRTLDRLNLADFELGKQVGQGKFGQVYISRHRSTGMIFALKKIFKSTIKEYQMQDQFSMQLKILYMVDHPNIVKLYGHFCDEYHVFLLMEYVQGGQLMERLKSSEKYVSKIIDQLLDAVDHLHSRGIVHRDIKPQNIVIAFGDTAKLCDFGWAGIFNNKIMKTTFCGTLDYVSPEMMEKGLYTYKVDAWSLGVLCFELLTGFAPFHTEIINWRIKGSLRTEHWNWNISYPPEVSGLAESFMRSLLKQNPNDRANLRACKNYFFIRKYKEPEGENHIQIII